ncbi:MAG: hypothetical protein OXJ90_20680 [Spirochaetaceae bacterium]|nr:hypothetical protein [Spirochaetaceae bacterium]
MRRLDLQEYVRSDPIPLRAAERDDLSDALTSLTIEPASGVEGAYHLTPGSTVGALDVGGLSVSIRPKLDISRVLFLASYAMRAFDVREERFDFEEAPTLVEALASALAAAARSAFARGLLHGYRTEEEALHTVRGRIRFDDQIRRRFGVPVPVEVRYDEFTDDITANRLVKAAAVRLGRMRLRSAGSREGLRWVAARLENVSLVEFTAVPEVTFDRLSERYREVVALSRLILSHTSFETNRGRIRAPGFLMDMNVVFQGFVTQALRDALRVSDHVFRSDEHVRGVTLDEARKVTLKPDLSWWDGSTCTFVGDAKYKRIRYEHAPNADLYQLLAYATALDLPGGLLVYAQGEAEQETHQVRHAGMRLKIGALDLSGTIDELLTRIDELAEQIRALRGEARHMSRAA